MIATNYICEFQKLAKNSTLDSSPPEPQGAEPLPNLAEQTALIPRAARLVRLAEPVEPRYGPIHRPNTRTVALDPGTAPTRRR